MSQDTPERSLSFYTLHIDCIHDRMTSLFSTILRSCQLFQSDLRVTMLNPSSLFFLQPFHLQPLLSFLYIATYVQVKYPYRISIYFSPLHTLP
jgi:hypothetical protein